MKLFGSKLIPLKGLIFIPAKRPMLCLIPRNFSSLKSNTKDAFSTVQNNAKSVNINDIQKNQAKANLKHDIQILKSLLSYVWPNDSKIRARVIVAFSLLISGKLLNITVPWIFKQIVDLLNVQNVDSLHLIGSLLIAYGAARLGTNVFQELRNAVFGSVAQSTIRTAAKNIFNHLLYLSNSFHQKRQTGGLVRAIDRGTKGINQVLSATVFHIIPTTVEISIVCGILTYSYGAPYALVTLSTVAVYSLFTIYTTQWRLSFRKGMNFADNKAASTATDSLLNVEQVQQYNNQEFETAAYDKSLLKYQDAAIKNTTSLSILNAGQNAIFSISLAIMVIRIN
jgi:ABC transporter ATM